MATSRKYAALPDLDSAPDIYETPDLTDGASTVPTTLTARSGSRASSISSRDHESEDGISRARLQPSQARNQFTPAHVDARDVDFSDRIVGKRKSYKASSRKWKHRQDEARELGDLSDEEDESLERKLARLRREVEEVKEEVGRRRLDKKQQGETLEQEDENQGAIESLSGLLDSVHGGVNGSGTTAQLALTEKLSRSLQVQDTPHKTPADSATGPSKSPASSYTISYAPKYAPTHALARAAAFDKRLTELEETLGLSNPLVPRESAKPILPTLDLLSSQISTLTTTSASSLDGVSRRIRQLSLEADQAHQEKINSKEAVSSPKGGSAADGAAPSSELEQEQTAKINALFGALTMIENLHPVLPPVLERLRSLRKLHAEAAVVAENLNDIDKKQGEVSVEIGQWKAGLEKVEAAVKGSESVLRENSKEVEGWVRELEEKIRHL